MPLVVDRLVSGKRVVCNVCGRTHQVDYGFYQHPTERRVMAKNDEALLVRDYDFWYIAYSRSHYKKLRGTRMYTQYLAFCSSCYYRLDTCTTLANSYQATLSMFSDFVSANHDSVYEVPNTKIDENGDAFVPESENEEDDDNVWEEDCEEVGLGDDEPSDDLVYITPVHDFIQTGHSFSLFNVFTTNRALWESDNTMVITIDTRDGSALYPAKSHFRELTEEEQQIKKDYIVEDSDGIPYRVNEVLTSEDGDVICYRCVSLVDGVVTEISANTTLKIKRLPDSTQECEGIWRSVNIWRHHTMQL
jgi:hypothetical protein